MARMKATTVLEPRTSLITAVSQTHASRARSAPALVIGLHASDNRPPELIAALGRPSVWKEEDAPCGS